jgi:hypothetical protein
MPVEADPIRHCSLLVLMPSESCRSIYQTTWWLRWRRVALHPVPAFLTEEGRCSRTWRSSRSSGAGHGNSRLWGTQIHVRQKAESIHNPEMVPALDGGVAC